MAGCRRPDAAPCRWKRVARRRHPGAKAADLRATPIAGIYEYRRGAELAYVTADGRYAFAGDLYQLSDNTNLSDARRRELRRAMVGAVPEAGWWCSRRATPRTSSTPSPCSPTSTAPTAARCTSRSPSTTASASACAMWPSRAPARPRRRWTRAEQVWCAADRNAMLTRGQAVGDVFDAAGKACNPNPVARALRAGQGHRPHAARPASSRKRASCCPATCRRRSCSTS